MKKITIHNKNYSKIIFEKEYPDSTINKSIATDLLINATSELKKIRENVNEGASTFDVSFFDEKMDIIECFLLKISELDSEFANNIAETGFGAVICGQVLNQK